jgi:aspartyl-tRNA(Asn)/glutamyl-tRNA(Gln) amidotransferase subunit A
VYAHTRIAGFGAEVRQRILLGIYTLTAEYALASLSQFFFSFIDALCGSFDNYFLRSQRLRSCIRDNFMHVFRVPNLLAVSPAHNEEGVHILVHSSAACTAPHLDERDGLDAYTQDVVTVPASLASLPALNVPITARQRECSRGLCWHCH